MNLSILPPRVWKPSADQLRAIRAYCAVGGIRNEDMFRVLKAANPELSIRVELDEALKSYLTKNLALRRDAPQRQLKD